MADRFAELRMYVAPQQIQQANEKWLTETLKLLKRGRRDADHLDLHNLWLHPELLIAQTCGYPLMTQLQGKVSIIGRPRYELSNSSGGQHCSLLLARQDNPHSSLADFFDSRGVINSYDSNSGMNLFRERLAPFHRDGRFFSTVGLSGGHRDSLRRLREDQADLAAVDSVTYDYLARFAPEEVEGLRVVARSAPSPTLPYIGSADLSDEEVVRIRDAMNQALSHVRGILGIQDVMPAAEADYQILLDYQQQAEEAGYPQLR